MGAAALSQVFNSCGFVPSSTSPCSTRPPASSSSQQLTVERRDVANAADAVDLQKQQRNDGRKWLGCVDTDEEVIDPPRSEILIGDSRDAGPVSHFVSSAASSKQSEAFLKLEPMMRELFELQDLNKNGVLEEDELIKLNEKIAMLHYGKDTDRSAVKQQYKDLFRTKLDPNGDPVPFPVFRKYMLGLLDDMDRDRLAQELILEQFIAEAKSGRVCFHCPSFHSVTDQAYLSKIDEKAPATSARSDRRFPATAGA